MNIEILKKLKTLENPNQVDEIKGNEKVLFDKRKNIIAIVGYPKTIQFDKVVKFNTNDWEYLDEQGVIEYLATKGINLDDVEAPIENTKEPAKSKVINEPPKETTPKETAPIETSPIEKKKGGRPSKKNI
jgi:hypothetical protein